MTGVPDEVALDAILSFQKEDSRREESKRDADLARRSFRDFIRLGWSQVEPSRPLVAGWHVDAIAEHLQAVHERKIKNLLITVPPGSAKSILTSVMFPAWVWTKDPGYRSTFASYDSALSTRDSVRCRDLMQSQWYQETFSPEWRFSPAQNEKTYYTNTAKGFRVSTSVGGKGTGWRGSLIAVDDPLNVKDEHSDAVLEMIIRWWDNVIYNRLDNPDTGSKLIIMQRVTERDLAGHVLREGGFEHLLITNEYDPERSKVTSVGWRDPRLKRGDLMCPGIISAAATADFKKKTGRYESQYQQNPTSDGAGILKSYCWSYWQPRGAKMRAVRVRQPDGTFIEKKPVDLPEKFDIVLQSWDLAFKDTSSKSDYVAGGVMAARGADRFMLEVVHDRLDFVATVQAIRTMTAGKWGGETRFKLIEDAANGPAVISSLKHEIPGIIAVTPQGGKVARARAASPEQASGNWYLPHPDLFPWIGDPANPSSHGFIAECSAFPNGAHDDQVDMFSQGANRINQERTGALFPMSEIDIVIEPPTRIPPGWQRCFGMSVSWDEIALVWICQDPESKRYIAYAEVSQPPADPAMHAAAALAIGRWIPGVMSPTGTGRERADWLMLTETYRKFGLDVDFAPEVSETGIAEIRTALQNGSLKVSSNLANFIEQYRGYRRDEHGGLPKYNAGVINALRTAWQWGRERMRPEPGPPAPPAIQLNRRGGNADSGGAGWML